jgi:hypothetical protein
MTRYSDYTLRQMGRSRLKEDRQQAAANRLYRQARKAQRRNDAGSRPATLTEIARMLANLIGGRTAKAQG